MKQKVYLAGGMHSEWREKIKSIDKFDFSDPVLKPNSHYMEYGAWDVHFIKQCDICFAYLDESNPSGYGLSAEVGYAKAINKTVIFVLEPGHEKARYFEFIKFFADVVFDNLNDGIECLKTY